MKIKDSKERQITTHSNLQLKLQLKNFKDISMKYTVLAPFLIFISACSTTYVPPTEGDTAILELPAKDSSYRFLGGASMSEVAFAQKGEDNCGTLFKTIKPKNPEDRLVTIPVSTNKEIFILSNNIYGNASCHVMGSFMPTPNSHYRVVKTGELGKCGIVVFNISDYEKPKVTKLNSAKLKSITGKICSVE